MHYLRIISEIARTQWAILPTSFRAILSVVEGDKLDAEDRRLFHAAAEETSTTMLADLGTPVEGARLASIRNNIGFLFIDGPIIPRADFFSEVSGMVSVERMTNEFNMLLSNEAVTDIVLIMDSPGGAVTGISGFSNLVKNSSKEVTGYVWGMAASACYEIASACHNLISADTGMVGSIGTVFSMVDDSERMKKQGLKHVEIVSSQSPNKRPDIDSVDGRATIQQMVDDLADVFVDTVATNRNVTRETVLNTFGGGAMFVANRAQKVGMIDAIGTLESVITGLEKEKEINLTGFGYSASSEAITTEDINMSDKKDVTAVVKTEAVVIDAAAAERERIQCIEALADTLTDAPAHVKLAATAVINERKFNPEATAENTSALVLAAVNASYKGLENKTAEGARELAVVAREVSAVDQKDDPKEAEKAKSAQKVNALVAGLKEVH